MLSTRVWRGVRGLLFVAFLFPLAAAAQQPEPPTPAPVTVAHRATSTQSPAAQHAFDEGLTLLYAFNPDQARAAFLRAAAADPAFALAYWGVAESYGVNINTSFDSGGQRKGHDAIVEAQARESGASDAERALIAAAAARFAYAKQGDAQRSADAYAGAMRAAATTFATDDDVLTLAAESLLDDEGYEHWYSGTTPSPRVAEAVALLDAVLARDPGHIGANHLLIHALGATRRDDAVAAARRLAADRFEPGAEHLAHMPSHAFMRVGAYDEAARSNVAAVALFAADAAPDARAHTSYLGHDCEFGTWAFMMAGEYGQARSLAASCGSRNRRLAAYAAVRFGRWSDLEPDAGVTTFTHGMWSAATHKDGAALADAKALAAEHSAVSSVAADLVRARVARERGDLAGEIASLEAATAKQDHLDDQEPPAWFIRSASRSAPRISPPAATRTQSGPSTRACRRIRPTRAVSTGSQPRSTGSAGRPTLRRPAAPSPPPGRTPTRN